MSSIKIIDDYIPVITERLIDGTKIPFDIYVKGDTGMQVLLPRDSVFSIMVRESMSKHGRSNIFISSKDGGALDDYLAKHRPTSDPLLDTMNTFSEFTFQKEQYFQIDGTFLVPGTAINFSLFTPVDMKIVHLMEAAEDKEATIEERITSHAGDILIRKADLFLYQKYLTQLGQSKDIPEASRNKIKATILKEQSKIVIKDLLDNPMSKEKIDAVKGLIGNIIDSVLNDADVIYDLVTLKKYDYYTYVHCLNVAVLSVGLGIATGMDRTNVEKLGIGAVLHDIGMTAIPLNIVNKQGKLNDMEFQILKTHVAEGVKLLQAVKDIPREALVVLLEHHEKLNGSGYPFGLSGEKINLFGRIAGIADCYDALTTPKPFKYPMSPFNALSTIARETVNYDRRLLAAFVKMLGKVK